MTSRLDLHRVRRWLAPMMIVAVGFGAACGSEPAEELESSTVDVPVMVLDDGSGETTSDSGAGDGAMVDGGSGEAMADGAMADGAMADGAMADGAMGDAMADGAMADGAMADGTMGDDDPRSLDTSTMGAFEELAGLQTSTADTEGSPDAGSVPEAVGPSTTPDLPNVRLSNRIGASYTEGTCFGAPSSGTGDAVPVPCDQPHLIEVYAVGDLQGGDTAPFVGLEAAAPVCANRFREITGVDIGLATVLGRSVLRPSEETWALGERAVACYVTYPTPTSQRLSELNPLRTLNKVSVFGLNAGDCLVAYDPGALSFDLVPCDQPHQAEVFVSYEVPEPDYPGDDPIDELASDLCFGRTFESFVGQTYDFSELTSVRIRPNADSWSKGDRTIVCAVSDGASRTGTLQDSEL